MIIEFIKENVEFYLDTCIRKWRTEKNQTITEESKLIASCYIDAYQSIRISLFGEELPIEEGIN